MGRTSECSKPGKPARVLQPEQVGHRDKTSGAVGQTTQVPAQYGRKVDHKDAERGLKEILRTWVWNQAALSANPAFMLS